MEEGNPDIDCPRFASLVLQMRQATTIVGFWDLLQSMLNETVPNDACVMYLKFGMDSAGTLSGTGCFRRYVSAEGEYHVAGSLAAVAGKPSGEIAIRRSVEQGDFASREIELLNRLHPHLEATLQRVLSTNGIAGVGRIGDSHVESMLEGPLSESFRRLTRAERKLLELVRRGFSNREIADVLAKSVPTVKTQLASVYKKFGVRGRSKLLVLIL